MTAVLSVHEIDANVSRVVDREAAVELCGLNLFVNVNVNSRPLIGCQLYNIELI